ncbi:transposase [Bradyrhizobium sp. JR3.5]
MLERGPAWMTRPYSEDLRELALARADAGETVRSIAEALQISPSCVTKWKNLRRETGGVSPGKIGGHKKPVLSGTNADWLRKRIRSGPFTLRKLTQELAARGIKTDVRAVWTFVHAEGLSFNKKRSCRPNKIVPISRVNGRAGRPIRAGSTPRAWSLSTRPGSKPTWRRCEAGDRVGNVSRRLRLSAIGRP